MPAGCIGLRQESKKFSAVHNIACEDEKQIQSLHTGVAGLAAVVLELL